MKIVASEVTRKFRVGSAEVVAVDHANLEIGAPEFVAVVGPSGSGKSTLLNMLGLNDSPTSGKILVDGVDAASMSNVSRRKMRLLRMGFVFQNFNLFPTLSALENVELPMALAGKPQELQRREAERLLLSVGLEKRASHRPKQLSLGEMQRVAIARALANDPEVVIADEPTGELDSKTAEGIIGLLVEVGKRRSKSVIVATHDEKVVSVVDRTYMIRDGKLKLES